MRSENIKHMDVFGFGHCCIDYLALLDPFPEKGKKGEVIESRIIGGGPVPTALLTIVKFGFTAAFCGKVGDDRDGRQVIEELRADGVDVSQMIIDKTTATARAFIWIDAHDASRSVALDKTGLTWATPEELDEKQVSGCRLFFCDGRAVEACLKGLKLARESGVMTVLDTGAVRPRFGDILRLTDYAVVSSDLADTLSPGAEPYELARLLVRMGAGTAVVTVGEEGAFWFDGSDGGHVRGFIADAVDTTGAGDVFHGGFIYALLKGTDLIGALSFANAAASLSCRRLSGRLGIPELEEVEELLRKVSIK